MATPKDAHQSDAAILRCALRLTLYADDVELADSRADWRAIGAPLLRVAGDLAGELCHSPYTYVQLSDRLRGNGVETSRYCIPAQRTQTPECTRLSATGTYRYVSAQPSTL